MGLKPSIKVEMEQMGREVDTWEEIIERAAEAEAKASLQLTSYIREMDHGCLRGNRPAHVITTHAQAQGISMKDPRDEDPRYQDPRDEDSRYQDPRDEDPRDEDPRYQDPRYQDPKPKAQESHASGNSAGSMELLRRAGKKRSGNGRRRNGRRGRI